MHDKGHAQEVSGIKEEYVIGHQRKGDACYKVTKDLAELCPCSTVLWKVELGSYKIAYLVEKISKQGVEGVAYFILTVQK